MLEEATVKMLYICKTIITFDDLSFQNQKGFVVLAHTQGFFSWNFYVRSWTLPAQTNIQGDIKASDHTNYRAKECRNTI